MVEETGQISVVDSESFIKRSQDLERRFHDAGQFYWFRAKSFLEHLDVVRDNSKGFLLSQKEVQDIDTQEDWELAELKFKILSITN